MTLIGSMGALGRTPSPQLSQLRNPWICLQQVSNGLIKTTYLAPPPTSFATACYPGGLHLIVVWCGQFHRFFFSAPSAPIDLRAAIADSAKDNAARLAGRSNSKAVRYPFFVQGFFVNRETSATPYPDYIIGIAPFRLTLVSGRSSVSFSTPYPRSRVLQNHMLESSK